MFGLLKNLVKLITDVVVTPIAVIQYPLNLMDIVTDEKQSKTSKKLKNIKKDLENIIDNKD